MHTDLFPIGLPRCVDAWNSIKDQRASDEKKGDEENRKRAEKVQRINAEHQAALEKVETEQQAADKAKELAAKRYSDAIAAEHGKLQDVRKQRKAVTELRQKAEEKAAAAARKATAAQTKVRGEEPCESAVPWEENSRKLKALKAHAQLFAHSGFNTCRTDKLECGIARARSESSQNK